MFDSPAEDIIWEKIGSMTARQLVETEKALIEQLITESDLKNKLAKLKLGYAIGLSYDCKGLWARHIRNKNMNKGFLVEPGKIPRGYNSEVEIYFTRDGKLMTLDDDMGGLVFTFIYLTKTQLKLNVFSGSKIVYKQADFPKPAIAVIENTLKSLADPSTKLKVCDEIKDLADFCFLKS